jgi:hypothetical protein
MQHSEKNYWRLFILMLSKYFRLQFHRSSVAKAIQDKFLGSKRSIYVVADEYEVHET